MATAEEVKLYGMWLSPCVRIVQLVLKFKGIPFEHIEVDLRNKSQELLLYNPVHQKVPVLLHNGKPVAESLVIIEYIEDTWKDSPSVFPDHPYLRAKLRFWANFIYHKLLEQLRTVLIRRREEDKKEMRENLDKLEGNMSDIFAERTPRRVGEKENMGLLDILMCTFSCIIEAAEEALGERFIDPNKHPLILTWMKAFDGVEIVKETTPPHDSLVRFFNHYGKKK